MGLEPRHDVRERVAGDEAVAVDYGDETAGDDLAVFVGERAKQQQCGRVDVGGDRRDLAAIHARQRSIRRPVGDGVEGA